jgi:hypothetical protein
MLEKVRLNRCMHDIDGVTYWNVAGNASKGCHEFLLFYLAVIIPN